MLAHVFPGAFQSEQILNQLMTFVKHDDDTVCKSAYAILLQGANQYSNSVFAEMLYVEFSRIFSCYFHFPYIPGKHVNIIPWLPQPRPQKHSI